MTAPDELRSDDDLVAEQRSFYQAGASDFDRWLSTLLDERNHARLGESREFRRR